jgi:hypothetical protein
VSTCITPSPGTSADQPVDGYACLFLTHLADKVQEDLHIQGQLIDLANCDIEGIPGTGGGSSTLYEIVLHNDPDSQDS